MDFKHSRKRCEIGRMNKPKNIEAIDGKLPVDDKIGKQRMKWTSKEFADGFEARVRREMLDHNQPVEWQKGWWYANWQLQLMD